MQQFDQEMRYTENPFLHEEKKVRYLDWAKISQNKHTVVMGPDHDLFVGKTDDEIAKIRVEEQQKQETVVATYIENVFLQFGNRSIVCATYMFKYVGPKLP